MSRVLSGSRIPARASSIAASVTRAMLENPHLSQISEAAGTRLLSRGKRARQIFYQDIDRDAAYR